MANVINDLIIKIREDLDATIITITRSMNSAYQIASEVSLVYQGKILCYGDQEDMKNSDSEYLPIHRWLIKRPEIR